MPNRFTNPGSESTYTRGSLIQITWETDLERIALTLWHVNRNDFEYLPDSINVTNTNSYPWSVGNVQKSDSSRSVGSETDPSDQAFLVIFEPGNISPAFSSSTFRIIDPISASAGATASSSSSSAFTGTTISSSSVLASTVIISSSPTTLIVNFTQSSNPNSSTTISSHSGMSRSAKAGIAVGIGIGIPLLLAMGIYLSRKFRGGRTNPKGLNNSHRTAVDMPLFIGATNFPQASQRLSGPNINDSPDSQVLQELEELRVNELNSAPIHQLQ
ncbi:hypothetical protein MMC29_000743 [Sticta canariensis]|nr:hypothetical protein [Sticta canariensis]